MLFTHSFLKFRDKILRKESNWQGLRMKRSKSHYRLSLAPKFRFFWLNDERFGLKSVI